MKTITVSVSLNVPVERAWHYFTEPEHITQWNFAHESWCCPRAMNDLRPGGRFNWRMEAKDGSAGFDLTGSYDAVAIHRSLDYQLDDGRKVEVRFSHADGVTTLTQVFEPEETHSLEMQRGGLQAILDSYKKHTEG